MASFDERLEHTVTLLNQATFVVAFTGAGVSTESGLSDFRSPGGLWNRFRIVTYEEFLSSHEARVEYWAMRKELVPELLKAKPNPAHLALAGLEWLEKLKAVITQNIDGLHQEAGNSRVIELHGTNRTALCLTCGKSWQIEAILKRLEAGELDPKCDTCDGLIKPATVSFGQSMPEEAMAQAYAYAQRCDVFLMIGSSLELQPAASVPIAAYQGGAKLVFINRTQTPYDQFATVKFRENAGEVLAKIVEMVKVSG